MVSVVHRESLLRRMRFPRMMIPIAATLTAAMTFGVNIVVVAGFVAWKRIVPQPDWLLLVPLLSRALHLHPGYRARAHNALCFAQGYGPGLGAREPAAVLRVANHLPVTLLPPGHRELAFLNPVHPDPARCAKSGSLQDCLGTTSPRPSAEHGRLIPIAITWLIFVFGIAVFKKNEPWFAERASRSVAGAAIEVERCFEDVQAAARATNDAEGVLPASVPADRLRAAACARRRQLLGRTRASSSASSVRTEAARARCSRSSQGSTARTPASASRTACCRRSSSSVSASTPSSPRATTSGSTAHCSGSPPRAGRALRRDPRVLRARAVRRSETQELSSGMQVGSRMRSQFRSKFEVLLLDEVLAVGDQPSRRSASRPSNDSGRGKTIVLVTHSLDLIERFADRALLLRDGQGAAPSDRHAP